MKIIRLYATLAIIAATAACASERTLAPQASTPSFASFAARSRSRCCSSSTASDIRRTRCRRSALSRSRAFRWSKVMLALKQYGPDASYGVVIITTKQASAPRS